MSEVSRKDQSGSNSPKNPEVLEKPVRRRFDGKYKLRILELADRCTQVGQLSQLLRREGLYSSHLTTWRRQRKEGTLAALQPKRRGRKAPSQAPLVQENERLLDADDSTSVTGAVTAADQFTNLVLSGGQDLGESNFGELGLRARFITIAWFLASTPRMEVMLRQTVCWGEELAGNMDLAEAIRNDASELPSDANASPLATNDSFAVAQNGVLTTAAAAGVLANDVDPNGDALTATLSSQPSHGSVTLNADGSFTYTPATGFSGTDLFTYSASDGAFTSSAAIVSLVVSMTSQAAVAVGDSFSVVANETLIVDAASGVLANDSDPNGDTLTAVLISAPVSGVLSLNTNGSFTYTRNAGFSGTDTFSYVASDGSFTYSPTANFNGTDTFSYTVSDGVETSAETIVTITVTSLNDDPVAVADTYRISVDDVLIVAGASGLLANDVDVDGDNLTVALAADVVSGSLTLNSDGSFTYTPNANFHGNDAFQYTVSDGQEISQAATVVITTDPADVVQVRLEIASTEGTPLDTLSAGESFVVNVYVEDLRGAAKGVFASYFDLLYDSTLVAVNGEIDYGSDFPNGHRADSTTIGTVIDVGAFAGFTQLGGGEYLLASVPFVALASGNADFIADTTNQSTGDDTLLFGLDESVPLDQVRLVDAAVQITPAGEGEASGSSACAAAADHVFAKEANWLLP